MSGTTEWKELPLGDICTLRAGAAFKPALQGRTTGEIPFIKVSDFNTSRNGIRINNANNWVTAEDAAKIQGKPFPAGTTVFAKIGEALKQNRIRGLTRTTYIDNNLMGAVAKPDVVEPEFLRHLFRTIDIAASDVGTAVPYVKATTLAQRRVLIPPLATQHRIATILSTYDDLIEVNRRRIALLEQMARLLFEEWFVRFRFPGHEIVAINHTPNGPLPEGWSTGTLGDMANHEGRSISPSATPEERFAHYSLPAFDDARMPARECGSQIMSNKLAFDAPAVLVSKLNPRIPRLWLVLDSTDERMLASTEFVPLRVKAPFSAALVYAYVTSAGFTDRLRTMAAGTSTSHQRVKPSDVLSAPIVIPSAQVISLANSQFDALYRLTATLRKTNAKLVGIRDVLLPRLISGQLTLPAMERELEDSIPAAELEAAE